MYLPVHMLPASLRLLPRLPLTGNGKIDRAVLATGSVDGIDLPREAAQNDPPGEARPGEYTDTLVRLVELARGLRRTDLGPDDDLVHAGVTSLEAVRLAGVAWRRFGWNVTGGQILRLRTLREIAEHVTHDRQDADGDDQEPGPDVDVSLAQRAMLAVSYLEPGTTKPNIMMRWQLDGNVDEARLRAALRTVAANHPVLRTLYPLTGDPEVLDADRDPSLVVVRPDGPAGPSPDVLMRRPFDLERMPPVRWLLDRSCLYAVLHHVAVDDAALATLHDALVGAYAGSPIDTPSTSYSAVCAAERRLLDQRRRSDREFWRGRRGSFAGAVGFGAGGRRLTTARARRQAEVMPGGATIMERVARSMDVTAYALFLAATASTAARFLDGRSVLVGMPVSSRDAVGGEGLLGCFANLVPLVLHDHGADMARAIRDSHAAVLAGLDHGLLPLAEITKLADLPPDETGDRSPSLVCQLAAVPRPAAARGVTFTPRLEQPVRAFYPVTIRGEESDGDLAIYADYDPGVLDDDQARHFLQQLVATLADIAQHSTCNRP